MAARWRVTGQNQETVLGSGGTLLESVRVAFELLDSGTMGAITIPVRDYSADNVAARIQDYADHLGAVDNLSNLES